MAQGEALRGDRGRQDHTVDVAERRGLQQLQEADDEGLPAAVRALMRQVGLVHIERGHTAREGRFEMPQDEKVERMKVVEAREVGRRRGKRARPVLPAHDVLECLGQQHRNARARGEIRRPIGLHVRERGVRLREQVPHVRAAAAQTLPERDEQPLQPRCVLQTDDPHARPGRHQPSSAGCAAEPSGTLPAGASQAAGRSRTGRRCRPITAGRASGARAHGSTSDHPSPALRRPLTTSAQAVAICRATASMP